MCSQALGVALLSADRKVRVGQRFLLLINRISQSVV